MTQGQLQFDCVIAYQLRILTMEIVIIPSQCVMYMNVIL